MKNIFQTMGACIFKSGLGVRKFSTLIACLAGLPAFSCLAAEPAKPGKFNLVFLVGVEAAELKPGVEVFVEPMFFTDGKELVFMYDYCRRKDEPVHKAKNSWLKIPAHLKGKRGLTDQEIAEDIEPIRSYCANKSFNLKGENYRVVSRSLADKSVQLRLGDVAFTGNGEHNYQSYPPSFPKWGTSEIAEVKGISFQIPGSEKFLGPKHFFLASLNGTLLADLMPVQNSDDKQIAQIVAQANVYGKNQMGMVKPACIPKGTSCSAYETIPDRRADYVSAELGIGPIFLADVDGDGLTDAIAGMRARQKPQEFRMAVSTNPKYEFGWSATALILGNGNKSLMADISVISDNFSQFMYYIPLSVLRINGCNYVAVYDVEATLSYGSLKLLAIPKESKKCRDLKSDKLVEIL